jgi:hypothetical protein
VAKEGGFVAIATAANSFVVVGLNGATNDIEVGEKVGVRLHQGVATLEAGIAGRER